MPGPQRLGFRVSTPHKLTWSKGYELNTYSRQALNLENFSGYTLAISAEPTLLRRPYLRSPDIGKLDLLTRKRLGTAVDMIRKQGCGEPSCLCCKSALVCRIVDELLPIALIYYSIAYAGVVYMLCVITAWGITGYA